MVSQKSMLPRGARSDFLGKKNVSLPSSTYYFQQRRSLYSAQDKLWAWHTDKPETTWQPSTRTRVQTGPSKSELEVKHPYFKTSKKWELPLHSSGLFIHVCDLGKQEKWFSTGDRLCDLNVIFQPPDPQGPEQQQDTQFPGRPKTAVQAGACKSGPPCDWASPPIQKDRKITYWAVRVTWAKSTWSCIATHPAQHSVAIFMPTTYNLPNIQISSP